MRLKNTITCILVFLISLAFSYESLEYFVKAIADDNIVWVDDSECEEKNKETEEKNKESEESSKKTEIINASDEARMHQQLIADTKLALIGHNQNHNFSSSDYSLEIYCPPELA
jgi:hypothetical protein